jgi:hypothetical protein
MTLYGDLGLATNNLYANYNALQATWVRTKGRYTINMNYTFGKAMGILNNAGGDQFDLANNYGVQGSNRKHIFNAAYSVELGTPIKTNAFAKGLINGWQLSGITQLESGANLLNGSGNFGVGGAVCIPGSSGGGCNGNGVTNGIQASSASLLGTTDITFEPLLTCNPTSNLGKNQYINPNCFAVPTQLGENGPTVIPPVYGPAFFNSDLGMFKNFNISESKKLQFRFNAYNFLNHPLWSFYNGTNLGSVGFSAPNVTNTPNWGTVVDKQGHRVVQVAVKFYF